MSVSADIKKMFQELIVPELTGLKTNISTLTLEISSFKEITRSENKRLEDKIDGFRNEIKSEIRRVDEKLDIALEIRERLAAIESKVGMHTN